MVSMKVLDSRDAWLQNRMAYIGGSDSASVVGKNPWKDNVRPEKGLYGQNRNSRNQTTERMVASGEQGSFNRTVNERP